MTITAYPNPSASSYWRFVDPFAYLRTRGINAVVADGPITEAQVAASDIVVLHNCIDRSGIDLIRHYQAMRKLKLVVEQDDWVDVEESNPYKEIHELTDAQAIIRETLAAADLVTTTTDFLAEQLRPINRNVEILPNSLNLRRWDVYPKHRNDSDTIRIGWVGSVTHLQDLEPVIPALRKLSAEFPQVRYVFMGDWRVKELVRGLPAEVMLGVPFELYPQRLNGLRLDIGIAPLRDTYFNRCKSNIKYLEYSINRIPGVYAPIVYNMRGFEPTFGLIARNEREWYACLKNLVISPNLRYDIAGNAHTFVSGKFSLDRQGHKWQRAYERLFARTESVLT